MQVDDDFVRVGGKSYAINKINSIEVRERAPYGRAGAIIMGCLAVMLLMSFFGSLSGDDSSTGILLFAAIFGGLAYWQWQRSKIREYQLFLMTSSQEAQALVSRDGDEIDGLRAQIERAMKRHSRLAA